MAMTFLQYLNGLSIPYQTGRRLKVDYWWAGLGYYTLSLVIIISYGIGVFNSGTYLKDADVLGTVNPYVDDTTHPSKTCEANGDCATVFAGLTAASYCTSASMSYEYSDTFKYIGAGGTGGPNCEQVNAYEVSTKDENIATFSTVYTEWQKFAWPCADAATHPMALAGTANCDAGTSTVEPSGQCSCTAERAVFPLAIEDYTVHMPHGYTVHDLNKMSWKGWSYLPDALPEDGIPSVLDTTLMIPDGAGGFTERHVRGGEDIKFTLGEILAMVGVDLNAENRPAGRDARGDTDTAFANRYPTFRHTGLSIEFDLEYTNREVENEIEWGDTRVIAKVNVANATMSWSSVGPTTFYPTYPTGATGNQAYHRVIRYPQDVRIKFVSRGKVYAFDTIVLINSLISLFVLMGIAGTVMDAIVFYMLPNGVSAVLQNKRAEKVTRRTAFRQMGMQAAILVKQFRALDTDGEGTLSMAELTKIFGELPAISAEQAVQIAKTILTSANGKVDKGLDFKEFMTIMAGDGVDFGKYLEQIKYTAGKNFMKRMSTDGQHAMAAYAEAEEANAAPTSSTERPTMEVAVKHEQPKKKGPPTMGKKKAPVMSKNVDESI